MCLSLGITEDEMIETLTSISALLVVEEAFLPLFDHKLSFFLMSEKTEEENLL